ncbi:hypothetical protein BJ875DRAFT_513471 [Amylocarpus encephaloides]|uniref:Uncharacterized protein n=1 Tax=Amylocarpus encephaloides TaxID=45428 RepID=A0A9P7YGZ2_9HELO|nr:hypothetical protein BJ875DRAFT_513471 [Amylocarpus encephaloides]
MSKLALDYLNIGEDDAVGGRHQTDNQNPRNFDWPEGKVLIQYDPNDSVTEITGAQVSNQNPAMCGTRVQNARLRIWLGGSSGPLIDLVWSAWEHQKVGVTVAQRDNQGACPLPRSGNKVIMVESNWFHSGFPPTFDPVHASAMVAESSLVNKQTSLSISSHSMSISPSSIRAGTLSLNVSLALGHFIQVGSSTSHSYTTSSLRTSSPSGSPKSQTVPLSVKIPNSRSQTKSSAHSGSKTKVTGEIQQSSPTGGQHIPVSKSSFKISSRTIHEPKVPTNSRQGDSTASHGCLAFSPSSNVPNTLVQGTHSGNFVSAPKYGGSTSAIHASILHKFPLKRLTLFKTLRGTGGLTDKPAF